MFLRKPSKEEMKDISMEEFEIQLMELIRKHAEVEFEIQEKSKIETKKKDCE